MTVDHQTDIGSVTTARPEIRKIGAADLWDALASGYQDFLAKPSHIAFLCILYPIIGLVLSRIALNNDLLPLIYPLVTGYALVGPIAAIGLYELSRRREQGKPISWRNVFGVLGSPSLGGIVILSVGLTALFLAWLATALSIYEWIYGDAAPASLGVFLADVLSTGQGWLLITVGSGVGFVFAAVVLTFGVVSFPMLLDRDVGVVTALHTSARAVAANPGAMALWGLMVAGTLLLGTLPLFVGLIVALPVLGHATWHLYRKLVV